MHRRIIGIAAQGLAAILLVTLLAACGAPPRSAGPAPTPIPTLMPVTQATATPAPQSATGQPGAAVARHGGRRQTRPWPPSPRPTFPARACARRATSG